MKSMNARAPFSFFAPFRTPANSTWLKHDDETTPIDGTVFLPFENTTSAAVNGWPSRLRLRPVTLLVTVTWEITGKISRLVTVARPLESVTVSWMR